MKKQAKFGLKKFFLRYRHMVIEALRASQKVYLSSCRTSTNMFKHRFFHLKKKIFFWNSGSDKGQKYFFWSYQLLRNFLWRSRNCMYWLYRLSQIWGRTVSYIFSGFWGHHGVFRPFFRHREAKMGKKKYHQKKRTSLGYLLEKKSQLSDKKSLRYLKKLLGFFFVPSRYTYQKKSSAQDFDFENGILEKIVLFLFLDMWTWNFFW